MRLPRACLALALVFALLTSVRPAAAEDAPPPPPAPPVPPIERLFAPLRESMKDLPPFLRDTDLKLHFRSYYFDRENPEGGPRNEAWAFGGWAGYKSGWLFDVFGIGATFFGSAPLYAPDDKGGTLLLKPGQKGYAVFGEAYAAVRYHDYVLAKGYRQMVNQAYINAIDNRMTPNTFEGITAGGKVDVVQYFAGYLSKIKPRNQDKFVFMSQQAGAVGSDDGVILGSVRVTPLAGLVKSTPRSNTASTPSTRRTWKAPTSCRSTRTGSSASAPSSRTSARWATSSWPTRRRRTGAHSQEGVRVQALYRELALTLTSAFSITGSGNSIQIPWGYTPNYLLMMDRDFNRANEKAVLFGAACDFSTLVAQGLTGNFNFAAGWDAIDPRTRGERAGPAGVRRHLRLPPALAPARVRPGLVAPRARRHPRSRGIQARLAGAPDPQLGARPLLKHLCRTTSRSSGWAARAWPSGCCCR